MVAPTKKSTLTNKLTVADLVTKELIKIVLKIFHKDSITVPAILWNIDKTKEAEEVRLLVNLTLQVKQTARWISTILPTCFQLSLSSKPSSEVTWPENTQLLS